MKKLINQISESLGNIKHNDCFGKIIICESDNDVEAEEFFNKTEKQFMEQKQKSCKQVIAISSIAQEIKCCWKNINYAAEPYLQAMCTLNLASDSFLCEDGTSIIRYFLANATGWRGEDARRIKKELNDMIK